MILNDDVSECITLDRLTYYYLDNYIKANYSKSTYASYKTKLEKYVLPKLGAVQVKSLKKFDVQNLIFTLNDDGVNVLSSNSIRLVHCVLHKLLNFAVDIELIDRNVSDNIILPPKVKFNPQIYNRKEIKELLEVSKNSFLYVPINLAVRLGLRRSEILGLKWKHINFKQGTVLVGTYKPKTNQCVRQLKIPNVVLAVLAEHKKLQNKELTVRKIMQTEETFVVCKNDGISYNPTFISRKFAELIRDNHLKKIKFHGLRHTFATNAHNSGMPIKKLSRSLGHNSAVTTIEYYVHIADDYIV